LLPTAYYFITQMGMAASSINRSKRGGRGDWKKEIRKNRRGDQDYNMHEIIKERRESTAARSPTLNRHRHIARSSQHRARTSRGTEVMLLNTKLLRAFQRAHRMAATPACQTWAGTATGGGQAPNRENPVGGEDAQTRPDRRGEAAVEKHMPPGLLEGACSADGRRGTIPCYFLLKYLEKTGLE
jgi:hypothetical protein